MDDRCVLKTSADLGNLAAVRRFVGESACRLGFPEAGLRPVLLAVDEAATNIALHGYRSRGGPLEVEVARRGAELHIHLRDRGVPFDPTSVPPPDLSLPAEERPVGGMGVHLIRQVVDEISHTRTPAGDNELTLICRAGPAATQGGLAPG